MDLVSSLASQVGIPSDKAQALAGGVLGLVQSKVKDEAGDDAADQLNQAVPELDGWKDAAANVTQEGESDGGGLLGGLLGGGGGGVLGSLAGALGGEETQEAAAIAGLLGGLGLDASKATMAAPLIYNFLESRLSPELLGTVLKAAPFIQNLMGKGGDEGGGSDLLGGAAGALGGLFK